MSFILKSVELKNIKAHEHFLFEPAVEGITAISGENGAGKSSVVDAFAWCLYGTRPSGTKNRNLIKDGVDPRKKPVSVKAVIKVGRVEYAIERKIVTPQGATECNVWGRTQGVDEYTQVAGPAVTHVEKFIRSELGMNEKGFLTSVLIQQKQVDQIVSATPRERGVVIEELTGIASITQAISKTNENTRSLERAASVFRVGDKDEAEEKVDNQKKICEDIETKEEDAILDFKKTKETYNKLTEDLSTQEKKVRKRVKLSQDIEACKKQVNFLRKQAEDDLAYISSFEDEHGEELAVDTDSLRSEVEMKRKDTYNAQVHLTSLNTRLETVIEEIKKSQMMKGEFSTKKEVQDFLKNSKKKLTTTEKDLKEKRARVIMLASEVRHSQASHEHIDGEEKSCPVCKSSIEDPETLKKEISREIDEFKKESDKLSEEIKVLKTKVNSYEKSIEKANSSILAIEQEITLNEKREELEEESKARSTHLKKIKKELEILESNYDKNLRIEADRNSFESAKKRSLTVNSTIKENKTLIKTKESEIDKLNALSDESYNKLIAEANEAREELSKVTLAGKEIHGRKNLEYERLKDYEDNLKEVEESVERYNKIAEQIEVSTSASTMLSAFKADRIEHAIPTLEFFASDFLSKFTGGVFTKLSVDERFNTFVTTNDGVVRPVAQLSGGELSAASIALRLGIAMLLNSSEKNVLILDEVLVSMDEDRSRQIMETIGSMTNSQVIFIAHNSDINSIADKTVLVTR